MRPMDGDQIRRTFLEFFEGKSHLPMPSSSLVPAGDPTLLFTSAGMVQFKPYFMGETTPPSRRLTTSQKCFRTTDIDEVGDHKHLTFFEMLGNFSIGDYFKREAVAMAWELVTQRFGLSPDRLFATIYLDDEEAFRHWHEDIGIPEERIYRYGGKDNWWGPAGKEGPCGPCSEIHYDSGPEHGCGPLVKPDELTALQLNDANAPLPSCHPNCDCERFVELWNLVFMQFYQDLEGNRTPLPAPSIDTGLGLERLAAVLQEKRRPLRDGPLLAHHTESLPAHGQELRAGWRYRLRPPGGGGARPRRLLPHRRRGGAGQRGSGLRSPAYPPAGHPLRAAPGPDRALPDGGLLLRHRPLPGGIPRALHQPGLHHAGRGPGGGAVRGPASIMASSGQRGTFRKFPRSNVTWQGCLATLCHTKLWIESRSSSGGTQQSEVVR